MNCIKRLPGYHASIVPLTTHIKGAVPLKIFELIQLQTPMLFSGEGANIVKKYKVGFVSPSGDIESLGKNLIALKNLSDKDYYTLRQNCMKASNDFNFEYQINNLLNTFINEG